MSLLSSIKAARAVRAHAAQLTKVTNMRESTKIGTAFEIERLKKTPDGKKKAARERAQKNRAANVAAIGRELEKLAALQAKAAAALDAYGSDGRYLPSLAAGPALGIPAIP